MNWNGSFRAGKALSDRLEKELIASGSFQIITIEKLTNSMHQEFPEPKMMDEPLSRIPKHSKGNQGMKKMMNMDKQGSMNKSQLPPPVQLKKNTSYRPKKHKISKSIDREASSYRQEGSQASSQPRWNLEPAIHYINEPSSLDLMQVKDTSNGMMKSRDKMLNESMMMDNDLYPWPVTLGRIPEKASLYKISGQVIEFDPGTLDPSMKNSNKEMTRSSENARLKVALKLIQNSTGRVVKKQTFRAFSNSGRRPFSEDIDLGESEEPIRESSSMGIAISFLTKEMVAFVDKTIFTNALEGEIISTQNEEVLINIGKQNGVEIGDRFRVYSVGLQLGDPLTEMDLGDIYVKMGIIQVVETMMGFSKAVIVVGKGMIPGNMVQSFKMNLRQTFGSGSKVHDSEEAIPWWDFKGIKSIH